MTAPPDVPTVRIRQGSPTRVDLDGRRCRFAINTARPDQSAHVTVGRDGELLGFDVRRGDRLEALDRRWVVRELTVPPGGRGARVVLEPEVDRP